jgi:DNA-binding winged helix-turn-helix (wHTH) protein
VIEKTSVFFIGDWQVTPESNSLRYNDLIKHIEPKAMDVLLLLCQQVDRVLSADDIADQCWGNADIGDNPVHKAINQLRKAFDDKPSQPKYIETIRKRGYRIVAELNFPLNDELKAQQSEWQGASPFPGLSAFEPDDAQVFFGRNQQVSTLLERVSKQVNFGRAFCLILGPSGSGKSSLINAGVLPKLLEKQGYDGIGVLSHTSLDLADVAPQRLLIDLASAMLDWDIAEQPVFDGLSADSLAMQIQNDIDGVIAQCKQALNQIATPYVHGHFFIFIDRLEVLLSSPLFSDEEREKFLVIVETLATSDSILVFSACRNDFYPLVVHHSSLMAGKDNGAHFDLMPPQRSELNQMIRLPAVAANLSWSKDPYNETPLDEVLCAEAASNPDSLPMLQYTLQELYLQRSDNGELLHSVYQNLGGIEGSIGKKAEEVYQQLPTEQQKKLAYVLSLLVTLNPDGETITSRAARWSQLSNESETAFVQAMVNSRLFVSHLQNNEPCFSLAHEALLRRWPRANEWISTHQDSLQIKSRLQQLAQRWLSEGKHSAYLLAHGKPLQEAQSLKHNSVFVLDENEQALITASVKRVNAKRWFRRATFAVLCLLTVTAGLMSIKSQQAEAFAQQKRLDAESLLGFMVGEFADKLRSVKRMDLLDGISNKALEYFSQQDAEFEDRGLFSLSDPALNFKARFQHAQTLGAMGEVAYSRAKNDEASQAFTSAKAILDKLYMKQPENLELLKTLGANAFWLGQLAYDQSDFNAAQPLFESYRVYSEHMNVLEPDNVDGWIELSYAHNTLGSLYLKQQAYSTAKSAFESSLELKRKAQTQRSLDISLRTDLADTLSWLATTEQHLGNLYATLDLHKQGKQELLSALSFRQNDANILESLAYSFWHQAKILNFLGEYSESNANASRSIKIIHSLLEQDPNNEFWQAYLIRTQLMQLLQAGNLGSEDADSLNSIVGSLFAKPARSSMTLVDMTSVISFYQEKELWQQSADILAQTESAFADYVLSNNIDSDYTLSLTKLKLAEAAQYIQLNLIEENHLACNEALELLKPLLVNSQNIEYLLPFAQAHNCIGTLSKIPDEVNLLRSLGINHF